MSWPLPYLREGIQSEGTLSKSKGFLSYLQYRDVFSWRQYIEQEKHEKPLNGLYLAQNIDFSMKSLISLKTCTVYCTKIQYEFLKNPLNKAQNKESLFQAPCKGLRYETLIGVPGKGFLVHRMRFFRTNRRSTNANRLCRPLQRGECHFRA